MGSATAGLDHWLEMCRDLSELTAFHPMMDAVIDEVDGRMIRVGDRWLADFASCNYLGFDLDRLCFEGPAAELDTTEISQPAIYVTSLAALEMLRAESPEVVLSCEMAAGLSFGEYTALTFAGAMSFESLSRARIIAAGQFSQHPRSAIAQFIVRRVEIDHQVAAHPSELHERPGRENIERDLGRRVLFQTS